MAANTSQLKTFAQNTRSKLVSLITTKLHYLLTDDTAEIRGWETELNRLRDTIAIKGEKNVIEEVAYTWFNRVMALRYMDARGFNSPMVVSVADGQSRPQILEEAMAGNIDDDLALSEDEKILEGADLYRCLLIAVCNQYSTSMPFLFEHLQDYTELLLPDDLLSDQSFITDIRRGMSDADCQNVEIMGWLYQFYITDRKAEAEKNKSRRGGLTSDEQAAATQLFTPHWIVRYMVENSLGRIWMTLNPESGLIKEMPYYIPPVDGQVDVIPDDIKSVEDIRFLDPCMGSGHILVYAFDLFAKMYEEEGYETKQIPSLILQNNLFGIDIDPRCYQLASFALTMKAREYYRRYLRKPVTPNVIALEPIDRQTIESAGNWPKDSLIWQMEYLDTIGSLLKITPEESQAIHVGEGIFAQQQKLMKQQAEYLSRSYHCVVTNPPYLGKGQSDALKKYLANQFSGSKADTYAAFIDKLSTMPCKNGYCGMVTMESWMFLSSFAPLRNKILSDVTIQSLSHFDWHIMHIAFGTVAFIIKNKTYTNEKAVYSYLKRNDIDSDIDCPYFFPKKDNGRYSEMQQSEFKKIPGMVLSYWLSPSWFHIFEFDKIKSISISDGQTKTGDNGKYLRNYWEVSAVNVGINKKWIFYAKGGPFRRWYGNIQDVINWSEEARLFYRKDKIARILPEYLWYKEGITWNYISSSQPGFRFLPTNAVFDVGGSSLFFMNREDIIPVMAIANNKISRELLKVFNPTINVQVVDVQSLPVSKLILKDNNIKRLSRDCILLSKSDWDAHETSWDFQTNELVRVAREKNLKTLHSILSFYKREWEEKFFQLHENEEELNRKFIEIYGLQDELSPDVPLNEVTILQKGEISIEEDEVVWHDDVIIKQFISYLVGCFMGRYSIERPGLIIANQGQKPEDLDFKSTTIEIDDDGIIPIIQEQDFFADDMAYRVETALESLFGKDNKDRNLLFIEKALREKLRDYFFKKYYADHTEMYSVKGAKRPVYWLFTSKMGDKKKKGYFKALVYMHRMESDTLSKLHADYVVPYLSKLDRLFRELEDELSRDDLSNRKKVLTQAEEIRGKIREVKEFADELAKMASHRLTIDLDDGVALNYPKFYPLLEPIKFPKPSEE